MKSLDQLLAQWEDGTLSTEDVAELKQLLAAPEARARLVEDWLFYEAVFGALKLEAIPEEAPQTAASLKLSAQPSSRPRLAADKPFRRPVPPRIRWWPHVVWREVTIPLRWALGTVLVVALAVFAVSFYAHHTPAALLAEAEGKVTVERDGSAQPARSGQPLYAEDIVHVSSSGLARLKWQSESTEVQLASGTELQLASPLLGKRWLLKKGRLTVTAAPQSSWQPMVVSTAEAEARVVGTVFSLAASAQASRLEVLAGAVKWRQINQPSSKAKAEAVVTAGHIGTVSPDEGLQVLTLAKCALRKVLALKRNAALGSAGGKELGWDTITRLVGEGSTLNVPPGETNRFEQRIRCYITPPVTGNYTFWIYSEDESQLWLSPDANAAGRRRIASISTEASHRIGIKKFSPSITATPGIWIADSCQKSVAQRLVAGRRFYLEIRHKVEPDNFVMVAWTKPGQRSPPEIIGGEHLSPYLEAAQ